MAHDRVTVCHTLPSRGLPDDGETQSSAPEEASGREDRKDAQASKATRILEACNGNDVPMLIGLASSPKGLMEDGIRRLACTS